jgi:hypothetical protein
MRRILIAVTAMLWCWPGQADAQTQSPVPDTFRLTTTRDLVELCTTDPSDSLYDRAVAFCFGFVTGAIHYHNAISAGPGIRRLVCPDEGVSRIDVVLTFLDWVEAHPEALDEPPVESLARSAAAEWPCPE